MLPTYELPHEKVPELIGNLKRLNLLVQYQPEQRLVLCGPADAPNKTINVYFWTSKGEDGCFVTGVVGRKKREVFAKVDAVLRDLERN